MQYFLPLGDSDTQCVLNYTGEDIYLTKLPCHVPSIKSLSEPRTYNPFDGSYYSDTLTEIIQINTKCRKSDFNLPEALFVSA